MPPRFVEGKGAVRAFAKAAEAAIDRGDRVVLLGSERDVRFLTRRAAAAALEREVAAGREPARWRRRRRGAALAADRAHCSAPRAGHRRRRPARQPGRARRRSGSAR
ncbi:hypothetical protein AB5I41_12470 [Sphingomonas sp. MMS24-JH45]